MIGKILVVFSVSGTRQAPMKGVKLMPVSYPFSTHAYTHEVAKEHMLLTVAGMDQEVGGTWTSWIKPARRNVIGEKLKVSQKHSRGNLNL